MAKPLVPLLAATAVLGGCALSLGPQTRTEFVEGLKGEPAISRVDAHIAHRRFDLVVGTLQRKSDECLKLARRASEQVHTALRVVNAGRAELTMQVPAQGIPLIRRVPQGGAYHLAVDIERVSPTMTRLTYYGPGIETGQKDWAAIKEWSDGQAAPCPAS